MPGTQLVTFDENGNTIDPANPAPLAELEEAEETELEDETETGTEEPTETVAGKYRIGDRSFATMAEAHEYAVSQLSQKETEAQIADAYRQGIRDAASRGDAPESVTPPAEPEDDFNEEEYFSDPKTFLKKFAQKIKGETQAEYDSRMALRDQSNQIWSEFADRHPGLADFRSETEAFVSQNSDSVRAIIATKGQAAGYDYIALKMREQFSRYERALKPTRRLANAGGGASPAGTGKSVTPKKPLKKPMTMAEQIRSIKKRR